MTGDEFKRAVGKYQKVWDNETGFYRIEFLNRENFDHVKKRVKIIARATSEDKLVMVAGIKQKGGIVSVSGDGITDAEVLG